MTIHAANISKKPATSATLKGLLVLGGLISGLATAAPVSFTYNDFSSIAGLTLNGDAAKVGSVLRVVHDVDSVAGTAYNSTAVPLTAATSFSTAFSFHVTTPLADPTDGFTFLLQNVGVNQVGAAGQGLGYVGLTPSVAVVFRGRAPSFIGVITGGTDPADLTIPFNPPGSTPFAVEGAFYNTDQFAWIDYNAGDLEVFLAPVNVKPALPIMEANVDIFGALGSQAFVGFSAGNGGASGDQDILSWTFTASDNTPTAAPEPASLALLGLGLAGLGFSRRKQL